MNIRSCTSSDAQQLAEIYNYYIKNTTATFEETLITAESMSARITRIREDYPFLIYEDKNEIVGYAYATRWKERSAYRYSVESTVYVKQNFERKGVGGELYLRLFDDLRERGFHCALAGITLPNDTSVAFHESLGFKKVGQLKEVGFKFNHWIDVGYWQLIL